MRIVIDMQGSQTPGSRNRGIGRYTLSLSKALARNRGEHDVIIVLSNLFPETIEQIRADFLGIVPQDRICVWHAPDRVGYLDPGNTWRRKAAELIRESFLASLNPDIVYVSSLFEGVVDEAVVSIGMLTSNTYPTAVALYDLIYLINRKKYLVRPLLKSWYENKLDHLRRADILLAISESARRRQSSI